MYCLISVFTISTPNKLYVVSVQMLDGISPFFAGQGYLEYGASLSNFLITYPFLINVLSSIVDNVVSFG